MANPKHGAGGNNPAIALLAVVGSKPPARVVINEFTTIASVVTHAQFIDNTTIKGSPLQLRIAADNVPNFVDLETGGWGPTILDGLNSAQTPTMANFGTLADVMAGCITRVKPDACSQFFAATTPPSGGPPPDTLLATEVVAFFPGTILTRFSRCSMSSIRCPSRALPASSCGMRRTFRI